jgi:hypothetical protein
MDAIISKMHILNFVTLKAVDIIQIIVRIHQTLMLRQARYPLIRARQLQAIATILVIIIVIIQD